MGSYIRHSILGLLAVVWELESGFGSSVHTTSLIDPAVMASGTEPPKPCCHYSDELKERIVHQHRVLDKKPEPISQDLNISLHVVQRTL